ncbi:hypothetical protein MMC21_008106 [Puttea exsequens]|nr:hypothetical protein [Puttea exsequens]
MAMLLNLPDEVLDDILGMLKNDKNEWESRVKCDKQSLSRLARTCRRLNILASRVLMREIEINVVTKSKKRGDYRDGYEYDMLMYAFKSNSNLASFVRTVYLDWEGPRESNAELPESDEGLANQKTNDLLALLSNMESLWIKTKPDCWTFTPEFLEQNPAPRLRKLRVPWFGVSVNDMFTYMTIPTLRNFGLDYPTRGDGLRPELMDQDRSGITGLELDWLYLGNNHLPFSEMAALLRLCSSIKTLLCTLPGSEDTESRNMKTALSPASMASLLVPFSETLVELNLFHGRKTTWPGHDGSRLDMSKFEVMRRLEVPASCFFDATTLRDDRRGVWKLLPPRLVLLEVCVELHEYFVYTPEELDTVYPDGQYDAKALPHISQRYFWLQEIAERKHNDFPYLSVIKVEEKRFHTTGARVRHHNTLSLWEKPASLQSACIEGDLEMELTIRKPKSVSSSYTSQEQAIVQYRGVRRTVAPRLMEQSVGPGTGLPDPQPSPM